MRELEGMCEGADPRELTSHKVNPANDKLCIQVTDEVGAGGAHHRYEITGYDSTNNPSGDMGDIRCRTVILFQNGPIGEKGVNGLTQEALLAICIDRLASFQSGPFACEENEKALLLLEEALCWLKIRTRRRMQRGVEGTHKK